MFNYRLAFSLNKTELEIFLDLESQVNAMLKAPINYHGVFFNQITFETIEFKFFKGNDD
jgi:hypothetical protein